MSIKSALKKIRNRIPAANNTRDNKSLREQRLLVESYRSGTARMRATLR